MRLFWGFVLIVFILLPVPSGAFDGNRKGFVVGGGLGFTPIASWSLNDFDESNAGMGLNLIIGYAWDERNMIVYEGNVCGYKQGNYRTSQGFNGVSWYHYFGPKGKSFFTAAGFGFYIYDFELFDMNDPGLGYIIGGGFEFTPHVQIGLYLSGGQTSFSIDYRDAEGNPLSGPDITYGHNHISLLVSAVAF
jgi:hypothetical protein